MLDFYLQKGAGKCPGIVLKKIFCEYYRFIAKRYTFFYIVQKLHFPGYGGFVRNGVWNMEPTESCFE